MNRSLEKKIICHTIIIVVIGLIALYSAAFQNFRVTSKVFYDQLIFSLCGIYIMYFVGKMDYRKFYDAAYFLYGFSIILLLLVHFGGRHALGARRWLELGPLSFQPSEFTKLAIILMLARYFTNRRPKHSFSFMSRTQGLFFDLILPFMLTLLLMLLIFKQPDLGTAILIFGVFIVVLFLSGIEYKYFFSFIILGLSLLPFAWHILKPYQRDRLLVFLNPNIDPLGAGYTIIQSKIAIGSGKILGKGWLSGTQNILSFLPERHTDFIFSVIGEEWGFFGACLLIYCYFILISCGIKIVEQIKDKFGVLVASGIVSILFLQVIINIGMTIGLFPIVGITLPFISYGRSSFLVFAIMNGLLLNLSKRRTIF